MHASLQDMAGPLGSYKRGKFREVTEGFSSLSKQKGRHRRRTSRLSRSRSRTSGQGALPGGAMG